MTGEEEDKRSRRGAAFEFGGSCGLTEMPVLIWVKGAGILATARRLNPQAVNRCHAQSRGMNLS